MYTIYADGVCIHSDIFALDSTKAINPKLTLEDCTAGSLSMTIPQKNVGYETIERLTTDITVLKDGHEIWMGRVLSESMDFWNNRVLYCEGELAFFNDSTQPPKEYVGYTIRGFLEELIDVHNSKVAANRRFQLGAVTVHDDETPTYYTNFGKTMETLNDLIEAYGGHMRVRRENGVRYLDYLAEYPNTCTQTIQMGVNLINFTKSWDAEEFATVLIPLGARLENSPIEALDAYLTVESVNDGEVYIKSDEAVSNYGWIEKTIRWDDVTDPEILLEKGNTYLRDIQFDNLVLELSALDMHYLNVDTEAVKLLDEIRVISRPHGLDRLFPVTKLEIPLDSPEKTQFKLGDTERLSLTDVNNKINAEILDKIENLPKAHSLLREAKENATAIMNLATNGFITITKDDYGTETLYISNTKDYTRATKLWKWNMNGLGYSQDGGQTYGLAITMDGSIVADYITSGVMNADVIRTGILKDYGENVIFDLTQGKLTMKKGSIYLGAYDSQSRHYKFEVDEDGNVYAGSGTFAGTLVAARGSFAGQLIAATGSFKGIVEAADFISSSTGESMLKDGKFKSKFIDLYGITVTNAATGDTSFSVSSTGAVTINGKVTMGAGSSINWANVSNTNINSNPAYSLADQAHDEASEASDDAATAYNKAQSATNNITKLVNGSYTGGTFIDGNKIYSPQILWGRQGAWGTLDHERGSDGQQSTDLIRMYSTAGIVIEAGGGGMRLQATNDIWMNMDCNDVHVRYNGRYVGLGELVQILAPSPTPPDDE